MRQAKKEKYTGTAKLMLEYLKDKDMTQIRKFIGLLKWLMEALEKVNVPSNVNNFNSLLENFTPSSSQGNMQPQGNRYGGGKYGH